ncbi:FMN-dependent NADH-azoreductase [Mesoplasma lactucae]|uniref:FMN dependent NADH:quinone oxidoreductase n=1 Tax=Mesoplasma lactucae ATCC 49193 TaxID=81460 RepID=A0A291ISK2_9MOLU|nr:FMN-dependent NADH-azoreductase [Mesoplasma lactucae]ATG97733.1 FMN-dependent NADH-azoreductase [Mesoplasma lactucae ATCC 49193]ATZ20490.1 FMN-dependent NADH-azoreductase [Mesoplasma lactucae ATCC 49193]MCL8216661.1 FMN-dependent NADH-azoreductase 2 [Mesoplasma lactucae ATCC 49193]
MSKVLVLTATISSEENSYSLELKNRFLKYYKEAHPNDEIEEIDLNTFPIAQQTLNVDNQKDYWGKDAMGAINQLRNTDKLIVVSPMHNFNIPAMLKNYLDHILLANETFSYKYSVKGEAKGLLPNLKVQILTTQGAPYGWYLWGNHTEYLRGTFDFVGAKVTTPILVSGTKSAPFNKMKPQEVIDEFDPEIKLAATEF